MWSNGEMNSGSAAGGKDPRFCVVIPMYNEAAGAERCVRAVCAQLLREGNGRLIAVDDGSRDGTPEILRRLAGELPLFRFVAHRANAGYGAALKTGARAAAEEGADYCLFMDSDLTNDPADIPKFVARMQEGYELIKASRFVAGGGMDGVPFRRAIFSWTGNLIGSALFGLGIRDCTNGFRAIRTDLFLSMPLRERGFPVIVEELYYAKRMARRFCEIPVRLTSRAADQRPTSFAYRPGVILNYLKYAIWARLRIFPPPGGSPLPAGTKTTTG